MMCVHSDAFPLADVFENFRNKCLKIYELDPDWFFIAPGWAWQAALKNAKVKLDYSTDIDMLLIVEKVIRDTQKLIINTWKIMINNEPSYLKYWDVNISCGRAISKHLLVNDFSWAEDISEFNKEFIKIYHDDRDKIYFLEIDV